MLKIQPGQYVFVLKFHISEENCEVQKFIHK